MALVPTVPGQDHARTWDQLDTVEPQVGPRPAELRKAGRRMEVRSRRDGTGGLRQPSHHQVRLASGGLRV